MNNLYARCLAIKIIFGFTLMAGSVCLAEFDSFSNVQIEDSFRPFLAANPLMMEMAGAKVVKFEDGSRLLLAVGCTDARPNSPQEQMRRRTVGRAKAQAQLTTELAGVHVSTSSKFSEQSVITVENGVENGISLSESLEVTESKAKAIIPGLPVIGTWMSNDGGLFYLAIGKIFLPEELNP